jgi:hypothetical protein
MRVMKLAWILFCLGRGGGGENCLRQFRVVTVISRSKVARRFLSATAGPRLAIRRCSTTRVVRQVANVQETRERCFLMNFLRLGLTDQSRKQRRRHALIWNNGFGLVLLREKYFFDLTFG